MMSVEAPGSAASEERAALVARLAAEKSEALARLAAGIAHELRNPLAVILARVQLLEFGRKNGRAPEPERLERALRTIEEQAVRASRIIENLSVFARPRAPEVHSIDLGEMVGHVLGSVRARMPQGAALLTNVVIPPEARTLLADRDQLTTALTHLVVNALEAMPSGGRLEIRARRADGTVDIAVCDTGAGVAPHDVPRIFDPFFSTKPAAAGLGLCVAQTIAEAHGGTVRLAAAGAPGAEFVLTLPARG